jgi:hypothetical protein
MATIEAAAQRYVSVVRTNVQRLDAIPQLYRLLAAGEPVPVERLDEVYITTSKLGAAPVTATGSGSPALPLGAASAVSDPPRDNCEGQKHRRGDHPRVAQYRTNAAEHTNGDQQRETAAQNGKQQHADRGQRAVSAVLAGIRGHGEGSFRSRAWDTRTLSTRYPGTESRMAPGPRRDPARLTTTTPRHRTCPVRVCR